MSKVVLSTLRTHNIPVRLSAFKPSSLRRLFPSNNTLRPNTLTLALFPHLHHQPYSIALTSPASAKFSISSSPTQTATSAYSAFVHTLSGVARVCSTVATLPVELARGECAFKQKELARIRDERAEVLGMLVDLRDKLSAALDAPDNDEALFTLAQFAHYLQAVINGVETAPFVEDVSPGRVLESLALLANLTLPLHRSLHITGVKVGSLARPSRLTLVWPQLVLLPPLALYAIRSAYASRASLEEFARDAAETIKGFWEDWVLAPLRDIVHTVRAGRDEGVIVTKESLRTDLDVSPVLSSFMYRLLTTPLLPVLGEDDACVGAGEAEIHPFPAPSALPASADGRPDRGDADLRKRHQTAAQVPVLGHAAAVAVHPGAEGQGQSASASLLNTES